MPFLPVRQTGVIRAPEKKHGNANAITIGAKDHFVLGH
jgi:hypothetical protein